MAKLYGELKANGSSAGTQVPLLDFAALTRLMGFEDVWAFEREHAREPAPDSHKENR